MTNTPNVGEQEDNFAPDIFIIPSVVMLDPKLQNLDTKVFGVVYWYERLRNGKCFASNKAISKIVNSSSGGVANSLSRLEEQGYIIRVSDEESNTRKEIRTMVSMKVNPSSNDEPPLHQSMNIIKNNTNNKYKSETLKQIKQIYKLYLILFFIGREEYKKMTPDERKEKIEYLSKNKYRLTEKRKKKIAARLDDAGFDMLNKAVRNISRSDFHMGDNDRGWTADLADFICRNYEKVEEWANCETCDKKKDEGKWEFEK